jgi:hypothetical protein
MEINILSPELEAALPRQIFAGLLARINGLRAPPAKAACA